MLVGSGTEAAVEKVLALAVPMKLHQLDGPGPRSVEVKIMPPFGPKPRAELLLIVLNVNSNVPCPMVELENPNDVRAPVNSVPPLPIMVNVPPENTPKLVSVAFRT